MKKFKQREILKQVKQKLMIMNLSSVLGLIPLILALGSRSKRIFVT